MFETDKIDHGYFPKYLAIAAEIGTKGRICEVGVWRGHSLTMWRSLFPFGIIVGVDNAGHSIWPERTTKIVCEQDDPSLSDKLRVITDEYDLIIDDASHNGKLTLRTRELLWPLVAPGGYYVVEDWQVAFWGDRQISPPWEESMFQTVASFLLLLDKPESEVESIEYRYGMAILKKRRL